MTCRGSRRRTASRRVATTKTPGSRTRRETSWRSFRAHEPGRAAEPVTAVLDVRGLRYELQGRTLVADVSFAVGTGETLVVLGRSGAGKTTLLRLINRLLTPSAGRVQVASADAATRDPTRLRRGIGYVIQEIGLFPHFTVAENVGLLPHLEGWPR